ncbi:MAG: hypothetical protein U0640_02590 [Phycisphaerales bacterium]
MARWMRKSLLVVSIVVAVIALWIGVILVRWYSATPTITFHPADIYRKDYVENQPGDRAWEALSRLGSGRLRPLVGSALEAKFPMGFNDETFADGVAFVKEREAELGVIREAAGRKVLGYPFQFDDAKINADPPESELRSHLPYTQVLRDAFRLLVADSRAAFHEGDSKRLFENLHAMLNFTELMWNTPGQGAMQNSGFLIAAAGNLLDELSAKQWKGCSDQQIDSLLNHLTTLRVNDFRMSLDELRRLSKDHIQRVFTDDGNGDGRVGEAGSTHIANVLGWPEERRSAWRFEMLRASLPSRREATQLVEEMLGQAQGWLDEVPWKRGAASFARKTKSRSKDGYLELCTGVAIELSVLPQVVQMNCNADMRRHAARIVLAAEVHRRKTGALPESLEQLREALGGELPVDVFTGEPLKYSVKDGRVLVYSVGNDRDDDGGRELPGIDAYKAGMWCLVGDAKMVDADFVIFQGSSDNGE